MKSAVTDVIKTLILAAALFFVVQTIIQNYEVFGASMEPSMQTGDHIIVNKAAYVSLDLHKVSKFIPFYEAEEGKVIDLFGEPSRGDVVIIDSPNPPPDQLIKRIVGVPGDTVEIRGGILFINGERIQEDYTRAAPSLSLSPVVVEDDSYFVLGDNRSRSNDSRNFGQVDRDRIVGKAWLSYWPLGDFGIVDDHHLELSSDPE